MSLLLLRSGGMARLNTFNRYSRSFLNRPDPANASRSRLLEEITRTWTVCRWSWSPISRWRRSISLKISAWAVRGASPTSSKKRASSSPVPGTLRLDVSETILLRMVSRSQPLVANCEKWWGVMVAGGKAAFLPTINLPSSFFPVPVSPLIRIGSGTRDNSGIVSFNCTIGGEWPTKSVSPFPLLGCVTLIRSVSDFVIRTAGL